MSVCMMETNRVILDYEPLQRSLFKTPRAIDSCLINELNLFQWLREQIQDVHNKYVKYQT